MSPPAPAALVLPRLGLGGAPLGNLYRAIDDVAARHTLDAAWDAGIRFFDTAPHYGQGLSERRLGDFLRGRSDFVLSTKVGRLLVPAGPAEIRHGFVSPMPFDIRYDYSYAGIRRSFEDSLQRLGIDAVHILFVHDIGRVTHGEAHEHYLRELLDSGYKALIELKQEGRIRALGVGVNEVAVCEQVLDHADVDCFLLAGRYTLLEQGPAESFFPRCVERGVQVILGGVYNSGILALGSGSSDTLHFNYAPATAAVIEAVRRIEAVCAEFDVRLPAAALQFAGAHPAVASLLIGLDRPDRVADTLRLQAEVIPREFWLALRERGLLSGSSPIPGDHR